MLISILHGSEAQPTGRHCCLNRGRDKSGTGRSRCAAVRVALDMPAAEHVLRYAAFTDTPTGGNPAGVVLDARDLADARMLALAAEIGYSETAFLTPRAAGEYDVRYFSPEAEVPFCGHATIATAVALAERDGTGDLVFHIGAGPVAIHTGRDGSGAVVASLTSVAPEISEVDSADVEAALGLLGWSPAE